VLQVAVGAGDGRYRAAMTNSNRYTLEDLPESPHSRQLKAGFPWLTFSTALEAEFRHRNLSENLRHLRINLAMAITLVLVFSGVEATLLGDALNRIPSIVHMFLMVPVLALCLAVTFSPRRDRIYPPLALAAAILLGLSVTGTQLVASPNGLPLLFPCVLLSCIFIYFMGGLIFYRALTANLLVTFVYLGAGSILRLPGPDFGYDATALIAVNLICISVGYMHEKISRSRFLETGLLRELVARDGLTGIQNRRMFDQHITRVWHQAARDAARVAVLLIDIDCFKDYNDRYGHQAGDECLRAVAISLSQCARRPLDFVARYGGEEFAIVLYEASREYVAEVLTRIQRSIAELNIPHEASTVASRLTVSVGAAFVQPSAGRTYQGLIQLADEALYSAKEQGRNCVVSMEAEYQTLRTGTFDKRRAQRVPEPQA
jgi:diguanylate cyclase (GGDEF)-like protein